MNEQTEKLIRYLTGQASIEEFPEQHRAFVLHCGIEMSKMLSEALFKNEDKEIERKER